jgi:hypothetical protein
LTTKWIIELNPDDPDTRSATSVATRLAQWTITAPSQVRSIGEQDIMNIFNTAIKDKYVIS